MIEKINSDHEKTDGMPELCIKQKLSSEMHKEKAI